MKLVISNANVIEVRDNRQSKDYPSDTTTIELQENGIREKSIIRIKLPGQYPDLLTGEVVSLDADVRSKVFQGKVFLTAEHATVTRMNGNQQKGGK